MHQSSSLWSVADCGSLLGAVSAAVAARGGSWETKRHTAHATTDLPASELLMPDFQNLLERLHSVNTEAIHTTT